MDTLERKTEHFEFVLAKIDNNYKSLESQLEIIEKDLVRAEKKYDQCQANRPDDNCKLEAASFNGFAEDWNKALQGLERKSDLFNDKRRVLEGYVERYNLRVQDYNKNCTNGSITKEVYEIACNSNHASNSFCTAFNW